MERLLHMVTLKSASEISRLEIPLPGFHEIQFCSQLPARIVPVNAQQSFPVNSLPPGLEAPGRARIGASTRLCASGTWSIYHPEADLAPPVVGQPSIH